MAIHTESLENLLASLREHMSPLTPMPALPVFHRGDVIEIQGPASSGKTNLLYHILASLLVPVSQVTAAVVYDTDAAFDIQRFRHLLLSRTGSSRLPFTTLNPHGIVQSALTRLHIFRPTSLAQLAASIANLSAYHASHMPNQEISILAIDSISTFYWADRFSAEQLRNIPSVKDKTVPMVPSLHHVLDAVQSVRRAHRPLVVLTNWALNPASSHPELLYKQHLHPFPVIDTEDGVPNLGAKVPANTDHPFSFPFRLAHHITLSSPSPGPILAVPRDAVLLSEPRHGKGRIDCGQVLGVIRSPGAQDIVRFTLQITDNDIIVHPQQLTEAATWPF